jgi:hypothetical protein
LRGVWKVDPGASSGNGTPIYIRLRSLTRCVKCVIIQTMKKDFLDTVIEEQKILDIGLKQSKANKKERLDKEKTISEQLQDELEPIDD